jgi:hypothetical protein
MAVFEVGGLQRLKNFLLDRIFEQRLWRRGQVVSALLNARRGDFR